MSCSDKFARWNILGIQGSLLSNFLLEPLYLSTIIVGELFHEESLKRALLDRIQKIKGLFLV